MSLIYMSTKTTILTKWQKSDFFCLCQKLGFNTNHPFQVMVTSMATVRVFHPIVVQHVYMEDLEHLNMLCHKKWPNNCSTSICTYFQDIIYNQNQYFDITMGKWKTSNDKDNFIMTREITCNYKQECGDTFVWTKDELPKENQQLIY